jgi:hypothetical protein
MITPGSWPEFLKRKDNLKLSVMEAKTKYNRELIQLEEQIIWQVQGGGGSILNEVKSITFRSDATNYSETTYLNAAGSFTSSLASNEFITVLPILSGFTASIDVTYNNPVEVVGTPRITTITNNAEGDQNGPVRSPQNPVFEYIETFADKKTISFAYIQEDPANETNPNRFNVRASYIQKGGDPSFQTDFSSSVQINNYSNIVPGVYEDVGLVWGKYASNYITSASARPRNISASVHIGDGNEIKHIYPNNNGATGNFYDAYIIGNAFFMNTNNMFALVAVNGTVTGTTVEVSSFANQNVLPGMGVAGSGVTAGTLITSVNPNNTEITVNNSQTFNNGEVLTFGSGSGNATVLIKSLADPISGSGTYEPYVSNSINVYTQLYGDSVYIEDDIGVNGSGVIDLNGGSIKSVGGKDVSLVLNDTSPLGGVIHSFQGYSSEKIT